MQSRLAKSASDRARPVASPSNHARPRAIALSRAGSYREPGLWSASPASISLVAAHAVLTGGLDQPRRLGKPIQQNAGHGILDLLSSQSPARGVLRSCLGDQRSGDVIAIMSALLDGVRGREPLPSGIDQQAGEQARLRRSGLTSM